MVENDWIEWTGAPVAPGTLVDVRHRDGDEFFAVRASVDRPAEDWSVVSDQPQPGDIVAYRLARQGTSS